MALSSPLTVVGLMNGMIGGVILVLPVSAYEAGYLFTIFAIIFSGFFSFYSCYLSIKHLGDQKDMNFAMQAHFNSKVAKILYDIVVWLGLLLGSIFYFELICLQWQSLTGKESDVIPIINAAVLFLLIFVLKYFDFGASLMAYGIVSIFSYLIFLIWVIATAPKGQSKWKPFGENLYSFGATMSLAFAIQAFFIPVLMKNPAKSKHILLTLIAYVVGALVYFYISFIGSFGIMTRTPLTSDPQTIEDYFRVGNTELRIIESIYLVHLYSCLPEFVLISKKRLFNIFKLQETRKGRIPLKEILYSGIFLGICLLIKLVGIKVDTIIAINGAIIGFFNIYFFPAILHVKCLYFSKNKRTLLDNIKGKSPEFIKNSFNVELKEAIMKESNSESENSDRNTIELRDSLESDDYNKGKDKNETNSNNEKSIVEKRKVYNKDVQEEYFEKENDLELRDYFYCNCEPPQSLIKKILEMLLVLIMVGLGAAIMVNGLISVL